MPATSGAPYTVPPEPNRVPAILLALAVHAALLAFLWIGISWQNTEPPAVEAEVWDMKVESAAAPPLPPPPQEVVEPEPRPEPTPTPPPPPKAVEPEPVKPAAPDINLEREKKLAEQKKQRELLEKRELEQKKERERELAELKKKEEAEKKLAEKKELEKKELEKKKLADAKAEADKKKLAAEKAAKAKAEAAEQAKLDKMRDEELKRMMGAAGSTGSAQKSTAPKIDAGYQAAIAAKVKSNTVYAGDAGLPGNPKAVFKVDQLPTGEILSVRLTKSSGVPQFDEAVERGINKSSPLPKKKDGTVERTIVVNFSMKDLD
ncbi:cell envelope integrity protein TolA [Massilia sp. SYSU DXS3249]